MGTAPRLQQLPSSGLPRWAPGRWGLRKARTTSDFYVASRAVTPRWNAAAIGGEYLSAASYLGIAGLVLAYGFDVLWYPVGYTAGYLVLLALVAAPLRRSGAYTLPDFAEIRLGSAAVRQLASLLVVLIGWLYLVPQLQGASLTLATQTGAPSWLGGLVVCAVVLTAVGVGGMRSITFAQAMQFWLKFLALLVPALVLLIVWQHRDTGLGDGFPTAPKRTVVTIDAATTVRVPVAETPRGRRRRGRRTPHTVPSSSTWARTASPPARVVTLQRGDVIPVIKSLPAQRNESWLRPLGSGKDHPLYASLSLILAICLGTMGLPHVLVRFYTNPDGRDTRRTTLVVIVLLSSFYLLPTVFGAIGRQYVPDLLLTGNTDATVLLLPERMISGEGGVLLERAGNRRRIRCIPVDRVRADGLCCRSALPGRAGSPTAAASGRNGSGRSAWARSPRSECRTCSACPASTSAWPPSSGSPSPLRPRRSAHCWCSACGGGG